MAKISFLFALFVSTSLSASGQTDSKLPPDVNRIGVETSSCETLKSTPAFSDEVCRRVGSTGGQTVAPAPAQGLNELECMFVKECTRRELPADPEVESNPTVILTQPSLLPMNSIVQNKKNTPTSGNGHPGFKWRSALKQYLLFLAVEHGFDLTQEKTRRELKGPFIKDYFRSVKGLGGWDDGGKIFTNYVAHSMGGAAYGFIYVQNDPKGRRQEFGKSKRYWTSRMKAMAWSAACSAQFEIGPLSQASIGNLGLHTPQSGRGKRKMAYIDFVITPTVGTAWMIGEDLAERYILRRTDKSNNSFLRNTMRVLLTPTRSSANLLRFKKPWYRDK